MYKKTLTNIDACLSMDDKYLLHRGSKKVEKALCRCRLFSFLGSSTESEAGVIDIEESNRLC